MADRIRKINADTRTTLNILMKDLTGFANINGMDVSANGTIYCADYDMQVIYKVYESGLLNGVLCGKIGLSGDVEQSGVQSVQAYVSGTAGPARFHDPISICVDASDNIYVGDQTNGKIKRISSSGRVKWLAGNGAAGDAVNADGHQASFTGIRGICVDTAGNIYVADMLNHKIKKVLQDGKTVLIAGSVAGFNNGFGSDARFCLPRDVCVDLSGNVYVVDSFNNCIRKIDGAGNVTILAGGNSGAGTAGFVNGTGTAARFNNPCRIAMGANGNFMYVMDMGNYAIRKVETSGTTTTFMHYRHDNAWSGDICVDKSGTLYILEEDNGGL